MSRGDFSDKVQCRRSPEVSCVVSRSGDVYVSGSSSFAADYSLFTSASSVIGTTIAGTGNLFGAPKLNGLADNGGPTLTMLPRIRFPGPDTYKDGLSRPVVDAEGAFTWQRQGGKKTYVYFFTEDRQLRSNRVIIRAKN